MVSSLLPQFRPWQMSSEQTGRILEDNAWSYAAPSFSGSHVKLHWMDNLLPISGVTVGDEEPPYNRIWYHIGSEGYIHSSVIQPVRTQVNLPVSEIPQGGALAEVTVPYTDVHWGPGKDQDFAYRFYYETTHWVISLTIDAHGEPWYCIFEDKWENLLYAPASHLRLIPADELSPLSPGVPSEAKRLEIRTEEQVLIAFEYDRPVFMSRCSSGAKFRDGDYSTAPGIHVTYHKRPSRHMAAGNRAANGYDLPGVPWVSYFTEDGVSIHGTYWHNDFGHKRSHGCINLTPKAAKWVFRWTNPYVPAGTQRVYERYGTMLEVF